MTDNEINLRVAEIEGWAEIGPEWNSAGQQMGPPPYATEWQWAGPLVEKYGISSAIIAEPECGGPFWIATAGSTFADSAKEKTPQRAISLAVIAAHEGK